MRFFNHFLLFFVAAFLLTTQGCKKDLTEVVTNTGNFNNREKVTATIFGTVVDEQGNIVTGANVTLSGHTTTTDQNGFFYFSRVPTSKRASVVLVSKAGYFNGSRTLFVQANGKHSTKITLMAKGTPQTFSAASGGTVVFDGLSISFPTNGIVNKITGASYSGTVNVYAHKIDPTTELGLATMPGDLRGLETAGNENVLQSFGMFVAELYDASGNALQIASGVEATITVDVPTSLHGQAPSNIPLWYFDEPLGVWIEDGQAVMQNGKYVGNVSHFTYWNNDIGRDALEMEVMFVDQNGNPLQDYYVEFVEAGESCRIHGYTDNNGWAGGSAMANATLTLNVYKPCTEYGYSGTPLYTQVINTGTSDKNLGTIAVTTEQLNTTTIHATVVGCNGQIANTMLYLSPFNIYMCPDTAGNISYTLPSCVTGQSVSVITYDLTNYTYSQVGPYTVVPGIINLGTISACGSQAPFLNFTITNSTTNASQSVTCLSPNLSLFSSTGVTTITGSADRGSITIGVGGSSVGTFQLLDSIYVTAQSSSFSDVDFGVWTTNGTSCTFTSYPATVGENVEGSFSLNVVAIGNNNPYFVTGSFRIPRQ